MAEGLATRKLAAILVADVVGYSRLMETDEAGTLERLKAHRAEVFDPKIAEHRGRIIKLMGDGALVEFGSVVDAIACAVAIQRAMRERNASEPDARRIEVRIGVNLGDLIVDGDDLYGDGLNVAARLESLADPSGICVSAMVYQNVKAKLDLGFDDLGEQMLKNIAEPVRAFRVRIGDSISSPAKAPAALPLPDKPSIAVLPFTNMSGDPEQEYFSDGISEDIITELSRFRSLFVIARNSSFSYKGRSVKVQEIGRDLGVAYVVEGSVRKAGNRVRVTAQLIEAPTGNHLWAERYDRDLDDIFAVQDELVRSIVTMIPGRVDEIMLDRLQRKPTNDMTAYDCLLRAEWILNQRFSDPDALRLLERAIEIDPRCARAYCRLANYHAYSVYSGGIAFETAYALADCNARKALEIDPGDASVQMLVAITSALVGNYDSSQDHMRKAMFLNPNDLMVVQWSGPTSAYLGDPDEAMKRIAVFLRSNPLHTGSARECFVDVYYMAHHYRDAINAFKDWHDPPFHMWCELAAAHAQLGQMNESRAAVTAFEKSKPEGYDVATFCRTHARMCRRPEDAEHWLEGYRKAGLIA